MTMRSGVARGATRRTSTRTRSWRSCRSATSKQPIARADDTGRRGHLRRRNTGRVLEVARTLAIDGSTIGEPLGLVVSHYDALRCSLSSAPLAGWTTIGYPT